MKQEQLNQLLRLIRKLDSNSTVKPGRRRSRNVKKARGDYDAEYKRKPYGRPLGDRKLSPAVKFAYDRERVIACSDLRMHAIPGFDARVYLRNVLRPAALGAAFGVGIGTVERWIKNEDLPRPLGHYMLGFRKIPAYTVNEALVYLHLLSVETRGEETTRVFTQWPHLRGMLADAREQLQKSLLNDGERAEWTTTIKPLPGPLNPSR